MVDKSIDSSKPDTDKVRNVGREILPLSAEVSKAY